jgi:hypothetical protein
MDFPTSIFPGVRLPPPPPVRRRDFLRAADAPPLAEHLARWRADAARRKASSTGGGGKGGAR